MAHWNIPAHCIDLCLENSDKVVDYPTASSNIQQIKIGRQTDTVPVNSQFSGTSLPHSVETLLHVYPCWINENCSLPSVQIAPGFLCHKS